MLVNAAREGLGCTVTNQVIDMAPFYFDGVNIGGEVTDDDKPATNTKPVADIQLQVISDSKVRLSVAAFSDALTYKWSVPAGISPSSTTTSTITSAGSECLNDRCDFLA